MSSAAIATVVKMMESLSDTTQLQVAEFLQTYIADLQDEQRWNAAFAKTHSSLGEKARQAKQQIAEGKAYPLNFDEL